MSYFGPNVRNSIGIGAGSLVPIATATRNLTPFPALDLNFLTGVLDPRVTFTRASTATYFDSAGTLQTAAINAPRFDYNPSTLAAQGLLIEEQRTNLLTYSEQLDNAAWTQNNVTVSANAAVSPNGTTTADNVLPATTSTFFKEVQQNFTATSGTTYTFSIFVKANGYSYVQLIGVAAVMGTFNVNYDLSTGTETSFSAGTSTVVNRSITAIQNGWYRISVSVTALTSGSARLACDIVPASNSARGVIWTGDGTSGVLMWGAQLEAGAFPTSYIPTVAATVTRSADVASMTGTNFSSWYNQSQGTFITQLAWEGLRSLGNTRIFEVDDGTANNVISQSSTSGNALITNMTTAGSSEVNTQSPTFPFTANTVYKISAAYATNNTVAAANGTAGVTDTSCAIPSTITTFRFGSNTTTVVSCIWYASLRFYPTRLPNSTLQALTA